MVDEFHALGKNSPYLLDRIQSLPNDAICRPVMKTKPAPAGFEGDGFPVRRAFALLSLQDIDPFIMMDQMGEVEYRVGEAKGTPWHPHRGFETVTYLIDGVLQHRDSNGGGGLITGGDTQWMTAGSGILHIEAPTEEAVKKGGLFHGVQIWVNLPASKKWSKPRYQDIHAKELKLLQSQDGTSLIRVIAGDLAGYTGPGMTYTPITIAHVSLTPGALLETPWDRNFNALGYVLAGNGYMGKENIAVNTGETVLFGPGDSIQLSASFMQDTRSKNLEFMLLGGLPIREPIVWHGPFAMNTSQEITEAFTDFHSGRLGIIPAEDTSTN